MTEEERATGGRPLRLSKVNWQPLTQTRRSIVLVPFESRVDEPEFRRLVLKHFPEVAEEIEDDAGLVHLEMASLERLANRAIKTGDFSILHRVYEFVSDIARHRSEVDSTIINAVHVSFLEGLNFQNKANGDAAKRLLPAVLLEMWQAQMEHNQRIGWMK